MAGDLGDALAADMARLGERPYAEVGVPMFLVADDLRGGPRAPAEDAVAASFAALGLELAALRADVSDGDVARLVEVLADRHMLGSGAPAFTRLSDDRR